jgi:hypothetical protein
VTNGGQTETGGFPLALRGDAQFGDLAHHDHRIGTKRSIIEWRHGVAGKSVEVGDRIVDKDEALQVSGGCDNTGFHTSHQGGTPTEFPGTLGLHPSGGARQI